MLHSTIYWPAGLVVARLHESASLYMGTGIQLSFRAGCCASNPSRYVFLITETIIHYEDPLGARNRFTGLALRNVRFHLLFCPSTRLGLAGVVKDIEGDVDDNRYILVSR